jgi:hypothetical protein
MACTSSFKWICTMTLCGRTLSLFFKNNTVFSCLSQCKTMYHPLLLLLSINCSPTLTHTKPDNTIDSKGFPHILGHFGQISTNFYLSATECHPVDVDASYALEKTRRTCMTTNRLLPCCILHWIFIVKQGRHGSSTFPPVSAYPLFCAQTKR